MPRHRSPSSPAATACATRAAVAAFGLLLAGTAAAADFSIGVGAGADHGKVDCVDSFACDRSSAYAKLTGGYRAADAVELQAMLFTAGRFKGGDTTPLGTDFGGSFNVGGFGLSAGYRLDLAPGWSVTAGAGVAAVRTRFEYENAAYGSVSKTRLEPLAGIGIGYAVTPAVTVGIDYDVTRFKVHTRQGVLQMLGLAVRYSF
jgi:opacity protein-like surface antigen